MRALSRSLTSGTPSWNAIDHGTSSPWAITGFAGVADPVVCGTGSSVTRCSATPGGAQDARSSTVVIVTTATPACALATILGAYALPGPYLIGGPP